MAGPRPPRTTRVRGFQRRGVGAQVKAPRLPRPRLPGWAVAGAPTIQRPRTPSHTYIFPAPPPDWLASIGEWVVFWYLMYVKRWPLNETWYYNGRVFLPYFYTSQDFTQSDFIVDLGPLSAAGMLAGYTAMVLDPITPFTHPDPQHDKDRRDALGGEGYLLVFLEEHDLLFQTRRVLEAALRGQDLSTRGAAA